MTGCYRTNRRRPGGGPDDPSATLETDVMRFVAILALCLVVIFALVQSLPLSSEKNRTSSKNRKEVLETELVKLEQRADNLKSEVLVLANAREKMRNSTQKEHTPSKPAAPAKENVPTESRTGSRQTQDGPDAKETLKPAKEKLVSRPQKAEKGFTLSFNSDRALEALLENNKVHFFMLGTEKSWKLSSTGNQGWRFIPGKPGGLLYQMDAATVPGEFLRAARRVTGAEVSRVSYGVVLPPGIRRQLKEIMESRQGGDLMIDSTGEVSAQAGSATR